MNDADELARRYFALWTEYLTALAADPQAAALLQRWIAFTGQFAKAAADRAGDPFCAWATSLAAAAGGSPAAAAAAAGASDERGDAMDELARRVDELERRLAALEKRPAARRPRRGSRAGGS